jgi:hypothetical protein
VYGVLEYFKLREANCFLGRREQLALFHCHVVATVYQLPQHIKYNMKTCISCMTALTLLLCVSTSLVTEAHNQSKQRVRRTGNTKTRPAIEPRIIGGTRVKIPYPYFASLEVGCGASLIHDDSEPTVAYWDRFIRFGNMNSL